VGGRDDQSTGGVSYAFTSLQKSGVAWILNVMVYVTDYDEDNEYVTAITANNHIIATRCNPDLACGSNFYLCSSSDVTRLVRKGLLNVSVFATPFVDTCEYKGKRLYVKYELLGSPVVTTDDSQDDVLESSSGRANSNNDDSKYTTVLFLGIFSGAGIGMCGLCIAAAVFVALRRSRGNADSRFQFFVENDMHYVPESTIGAPSAVQPAERDPVASRSLGDEEDCTSPIHLELSGVLDESSCGYGLVAHVGDAVVSGDCEVDGDDRKEVTEERLAPMTTNSGAGVAVLQSTRKFSCIGINDDLA
jgi:hypothetical protein